MSDATDDLPSLTSYFRSYGPATRLDEDCPDCEEEGSLWSVSGDTVCANCSLVLGTDDADRLTSFGSDRTTDIESEHSNSGKRRCVGGFPHAYEWGGDEDDPNSFYN